MHVYSLPLDRYIGSIVMERGATMRIYPHSAIDGTRDDTALVTILLRFDEFPDFKKQLHSHNILWFADGVNAVLSKDGCVLKIDHFQF